MSQAPTRESVIVAECGKSGTRAILVEVVDDVYRFIAQSTAPSTLEPPLEDLQAGLRDAISGLESATARRFAERNRLIVPQEEDGDGADAFVATVAAAPPLRLAIMTVDGGALVEALIDVGRRTPTTVLPLVALNDAGRLDDQARATIETLGRLQPDLLLLIAGSTAGADRAMPRLLDLASEVVAIAAGHEGYQLPAILFVGPEAWHDRVGAAFSHGYEIGLVATDGSDAATVAGVIEQELLDLGNRRAGATVPGFELLASMGAAPPLARSRAIELVNRFMAMQFECEVLTVDFAEGSVFSWARGADHRGLTEPALDLALGAANLLTTLNLADVVRWLPFSLSEDELTHWILNRAVRPFTIPTTGKDRLIEAALVRELLRTGTAELTESTGALTPDLIVGGSFFARWPDPATVMMALLDGLQPQTASGLIQVALDRDSLLPAIGALSLIEPDRAAELFEHDGLVDLGAYIAVNGRAGDEIRGQLERENGETTEFSVAGGSLTLVPLAQGERATLLRIEPGKASSVGSNAPGATVRFEGPTAPHGGLVGLIVDARSRPLDLPRDDQQRIAQLGAWSEALRH